MTLLPTTLFVQFRAGLALHGASCGVWASDTLCYPAGVGGGIGVTPISTTSWFMGFVNNICPECERGSLDQVALPSKVQLQCSCMWEASCCAMCRFHTPNLLSQHCAFEDASSMQAQLMTGCLAGLSKPFPHQPKCRGACACAGH